MTPTTYTYLRYMRDGSTKEITAVVRSKNPHKEKKNGKS